MAPLPERLSLTIKAIHEKRMADRWDGSRGSTYIAASQAAKECPREIWQTFRWVSPRESVGPRQLRLFDSGNREERRALDDLRKVVTELHTHDPDTGKQYKEAIDGWIAVKPDGIALGIVEAPKAWHVIEVKRLNEKRFNKIKTKGVEAAEPEHYFQMQLEMLAFRVPRAFYFVINSNNEDEWAERVKFDAEKTAQAVERLIEIAKADRPPGKISNDPKAFACMWCDHRGVCHHSGFARRNCRTCLESTPKPGGNWHCNLWGEDRTPEQQEGCSEHLYIPDLVPGEQIDANIEQRTVLYRLRDGREWTDGEKETPAA